AQAELAVGRAFHHVVPLQNHQKTVRGALVQLQGGGHLRQSQRRVALAEQIQYGEGPVQGLYFVGALRGSVSHFGPLFREVITILVSSYTEPVSSIDTRHLYCGTEGRGPKTQPAMGTRVRQRLAALAVP